MVTTKCSVKIQEIKFCLPIYQRYFFFFLKRPWKTFLLFIPLLKSEANLLCGGHQAVGIWSMRARSREPAACPLGLWPDACKLCSCASSFRQETLNSWGLSAFQAFVWKRRFQLPNRWQWCEARCLSCPTCTEVVRMELQEDSYSRLWCCCGNKATLIYINLKRKALLKVLMLCSLPELHSQK